jgi:hypothetical protein
VRGAISNDRPYRDRQLTLLRMKFSDGSECFTFERIQSRGAMRGYAGLANLLAFSSHFGTFNPITRSHRNTDASARKAEARL